MNVVINKRTSFVDLGLADYKQAWDYQAKLFEQNLAIKTANRGLPEGQHQATNNWLIFCEHPHVYTLGKTGKEQNLLLKQDDLHLIGATYYHINRGGDITYHGPGQLVGYPILDLRPDRCDVHRYVRDLEEVLILAIRDFGIEGRRVKGLTGVWVGPEGREEKIAAIGVRISRWITSHGFALNVATDLRHFRLIVPCGIADRGVTSIERVLGRPVPMSDVEDAIVRAFESALNAGATQV